MKGYQKVYSWFTSSGIPVEEVESEDSQFNPYNLSEDGIVKIDEIDFRDERYRVRSVDYHQIPMNDETFEITDYVIGEEKNIKIRVLPDENGFRTLVLRLDDEFEYNEDFHHVVKDDSKEFIVEDQSEGELHFWRVNDVGISYASRINDQKSIEFWDFSRLTQVDGVDVEEFVIVEVDSKNGWFQIWRGLEVDNSDIQVF